MEFTTGTPCWMQVSLKNIDTAVEFFRKALGWDIPPGDPNLGGYSLATVGSKTVSGVWPDEESDTESISVWLSVDNLDDALTRLNDRGVTIHEFDGEVIQEVMTLGRQASFTDPFGVTTGLWEPHTFHGIEVFMVPGAPCWFEHLSENPREAAEFYADTFNLVAQGYGDDYWTIQVPGSDSEAYGITFPSDANKRRTGWLVSIFTEDLEADLKKIRSHGGRELDEASLVQGMGRFSLVATPGGSAFGLFEIDMGA